MNERIKACISRAITEDAHANPYGPQEVNRLLGKFAELILKECLSLNNEVCKELHADDQGLAGYKTITNLYKVSLRNKIEEHFGVE